MKLRILLLILSSFIYYCGLSQTSLNTTGYDITGSGGDLSYTVGQLFFDYNESSFGSISKGVQHGFEPSTVSTYQIDNLEFSVYPNPSPNSVFIDLPIQFTGAIGRVYDLNGVLLERIVISSGITFLPLDRYQSGMYTLVVNVGNVRHIKKFIKL